LIVELPLWIEPETRTDLTPAIAPSAAETIAFGDLEATPLSEEPPHAEITPAMNKAEQSQVVIRQPNARSVARIRPAGVAVG
jgi:hypothetical protein